MRLLLVLIVAILFSRDAMSQQNPFSPPPAILRIDRESIRPGRRAALNNVERQSIDAQARLHSPHAYLVVSSYSGPEEMWWLHGADTYGGFEEEYAKVAQVPGLLDVWAQGPVNTANLVDNPYTVFARFREDLSYGHGMSGAKTRYFLITTVTVQPGHAADFVELRKMIRGAQERARAGDNLSVYEVESGMRDGTFLIFSSAATLDDAGTLSQFHGTGVENALGDEARTKLRALSAAAILTSQSTLFTVEPALSYPSQDWIQGEPDFWSVNAVNKQ